jgi:hypothetical protein
VWTVAADIITRFLVTGAITMKAMQLLLGVLTVSGAVAAFGDAHEDYGRLTFSATQKETLTAVVEAIDHETRVVTVRGPQGNTVTFTASKDVRNLAQVDPGDLIDAEYVESLDVEVLPGDGSDPGHGVMGAVSRTEEGAKPGVAAAEVNVITARIVAIDLEANTATLEGPDGALEEIEPMNPSNLERVSIGDIVVFTVTQSLALSVREQSADAD